LKLELLTFEQTQPTVMNCSAETVHISSMFLTKLFYNFDCSLLKENFFELFLQLARSGTNHNSHLNSIDFCFKQSGNNN